MRNIHLLRGFRLLCQGIKTKNLQTLSQGRHRSHQSDCHIRPPAQSFQEMWKPSLKNLAHTGCSCSAPQKPRLYREPRHTLHLVASPGLPDGLQRGLVEHAHRFLPLGPTHQTTAGRDQYYDGRHGCRGRWRHRPFLPVLWEWPGQS